MLDASSRTLIIIIIIIIIMIIIIIINLHCITNEETQYHKVQNSRNNSMDHYNGLFVKIVRY